MLTHSPLSFLLIVLVAAPAFGTQTDNRPPHVKVAAVQMLGDADWFIRNDPEWKMKRGQDFPVFDLDFGRIGILTCYDGRFPETFRILSLKGAEILVWINGRRGTVEDFVVKSAMAQDELANVSVLSELSAYYKIVEKAEDEYLLAGPPMSPLTRSYFTTWAFFDVRFGPMTRGGLASGSSATFAMRCVTTRSRRWTTCC